MRDHCPNAFLTAYDIRLSLDFVYRQGAGLLLAVAFLRRAWDHFERDEEREAVQTLESFARFEANTFVTLEALSRAEQATLTGFWADVRLCDCADCYYQLRHQDFEHGARSRLKHFGHTEGRLLFAAQSAFSGRRYA